jgi:hypothetical protein
MSELVVFKEQLEVSLGKELDLEGLEKVMKPFDMHTDDMTNHQFFKGIYVRTIFVPKGWIIIGKRHRHETCNILLKGELSLYMGKDLPVKRLKAPCMFPSEPGTKKMAYIHDDILFANVHPTSLTNVDDIERKFIIPEKEYKEQIGCHGAQLQQQQGQS